MAFIIALVGIGVIWLLAVIAVRAGRIADGLDEVKLSLRRVERKGDQAQRADVAVPEKTTISEQLHAEEKPQGAFVPVIPPETVKDLPEAPLDETPLLEDTEVEDAGAFSIPYIPQPDPIPDMQSERLEAALRIDPEQKTFTAPASADTKRVPMAAIPLDPKEAPVVAQSPEKPEPKLEPESVSVSYEQPVSPTVQYIRDIWGKTWRWIIYGKEKLDEKDWAEGQIAMTWFLRVAVLLIIVLLINFVRNRFNTPFVPALTSVAAGIAFLVYGLRKLKGDYQVLGQALTGCGIAALYFAIFSVMDRKLIILYTGVTSLDAAALICLGGLLIVSIFSGMLALRHASLFMALVAMAGGIAAPYIIPDPQNLALGIYLYLLLLVVGLCIIAYRHRWPLLNMLSLLGIWIVYYHKLVPPWYESVTPEIFNTYLIALAAVSGIGLLFMILPTISAWRRRDLSSSFDILIVVLNVVLTVFEGIRLFHKAHVVHATEWSAVIPAAVCLVVLAQTIFFHKMKLKDRSLLVSWVAVAALMLALIPALLFSNAWQVTAWAVLAAVLWYLSLRTNSITLRILSGVVYLAVGGNLLFCNYVDLFGDLRTASTANYFSLLVSHFFTIGLPLAAIGAVAWMNSRPLKPLSADFSDYDYTRPRNPEVERFFARAFEVVAFAGLFILLSMEAWMWGKTFFSTGVHMAMTVSWIFFAALLVWVRKLPIREVFIPAMILLLGKFFIVDWGNWDFSIRYCVFADFYVNGVTFWRTVAVRFLDFGFMIAFFALMLKVFRKKSADEPDRKPLVTTCAVIVLALALIWTTAEISTLLSVFRPSVRGVGVSLLWACYGAFFVIRGILRDRNVFRYLGIAFYVVITLKLIFFDRIWYSEDKLRILFLAFHAVLYVTAAAFYIRDGVMRRKSNHSKMSEVDE